MMMPRRYYDIALAVIGICFCSGFTNASTDCDLKLCPGPLYYYEELGCTPIFENSSSCCPTRYNCENWNNLPQDKCLVDGHVYENGEKLLPWRAEDPCLTGVCRGDGFSFDPFPFPSAPRTPKQGCYYSSRNAQCRPEIEVCANDPVTCTVDGKPYKIGEKFIPLAEPEKTCYCDAGYNGVNDERFCIWRKPSWCMNVIRSIPSIRAKCAPIYAIDHSPQVDCNRGMRCHKINEDHVIRKKSDNHGHTTPSTHNHDDSDKQCILGNLRMHIGEELNGSEDNKEFSRCICEVPPVPTCRYEKRIIKPKANQPPKRRPHRPNHPTVINVTINRPNDNEHEIHQPKHPKNKPNNGRRPKPRN